MSEPNRGFNIERYLERLRDAAFLSRFTEHTYGVVEGQPLRAYTRAAEGQAVARVYLSAGVHGDEPAGSLALLKLLRDRGFAPEVDWHLVPLVNPLGLEAGTRENAQGIDRNRDYRAQSPTEVARHIAWLQAHAPEGGYDLSLLLHEDWEASGFYTYELRPEGCPHDLAPALLEAARPWVGIDESAEIDDFPAHGGVIRPLRDLEDFDPKTREDLPEALFFHLHYSRLNYTLETPSSKYLPDRISAQVAAMLAATRAYTG